MENVNKKYLGNMSNDDYFELKQYRCLGTVEELTALKRKKLPMMVLDVRIGNIYEVAYRCPFCMVFASNLGNKYCPDCGQRIVFPDYVVNGGD